MVDEARQRLCGPVLIKRYGGRLYNTATLTYMSADDLRQMVLSGIDVRDVNG